MHGEEGKISCDVSGYFASVWQNICLTNIYNLLSFERKIEKNNLLKDLPL